MSMNRVTLLGNLGSDPEMKQTKEGKAVCVLNLATNKTRTNNAGEKHTHTDWHSIVCFGTTASNCGKYLKKGKQILVEGRIETQKWQAKDGSNRVSHQILASSVHFLSSIAPDIDKQTFNNPASEDPLDNII